MERTCGACGASNSPQFRFCARCGAVLHSAGFQEEPTSLRHADDKPPSIAAERRQITVLFSDLIGSTQMSRLLDPEELRELIREYRFHVAEAVLGYGGEVARYLGDGVLTYFGYPVARENDAARAVNAALDIIRRLSEHGTAFEERYAIRPQVRIGIQTGIVVAGDLVSGALVERMSIVGDAPNIAARLQELARPNTTVVGPTTARLVARYFRLRSLGPRRLKGLDEDIEVFELDESDGARGQLAPAEPTFGAFQNRDAERLVCWQSWSRVSREGIGQVLVFEGEAGIGKSRLASHLRECIKAEGSPHIWISLMGSPFATNTAFAPVSQAFRREVELRQGPTGSTQAGLRELLADVEPFVPEAFALIAELLDLPDPDKDRIADWSVARRRQRLMETLVTYVLVQTRKAPVVLVVEDIHWMDPSTQEVVTMLVRQAPMARLLLLVLHRTDFALSWLEAPHVAPMRLQPLHPHDVEAIIHRISLDRALSPELISAIVQKADGVPLYVEELTGTVLARGSSAQSTDLDTLPDTLRDALMERLDRLPLGRKAVQAAAVIGRTFQFEDLRALMDAEAEDLARTLDAVVATGILFQHGLPPDATYTFKHSLIRDAAYDSLLHRHRRENHRKLAESLAQRLSETCPPELAAFHFAAANMPNQAFAFLLAAGRNAQEGGEFKEALAHLEAARFELNKAVSGREHDERELDLELARGAVLLALKGYGAPEVRVAFERAGKLAGLAQNAEASFAALWGLSSYFGVAGPVQAAREIADQTIATAESINDPFRQGEAHRRRGLIAFVAGEFAEAERCLERAQALLGQMPNPDIALFGTRPNSLLKNNSAWLSWYRGRPAKALTDARETIAHARGLKDPYALVFALGIGAAIAQHCQMPDLTRSFADECVRLSQEQLFSYWEAWGTIFSGWADAKSGLDNGTSRLKIGIEKYRDTGAVQLELCALTLLADAHMTQGNLKEATATLDLVDPQKPGIGLYYLAEMWRISAALSLACDRPQREALAKIDKAILIARQQRAPMLELRASAWKINQFPREGMPEVKALLALESSVPLEIGCFDDDLLSKAKTFILPGEVQ